jgi:hypothetical protein
MKSFLLFFICFYAVNLKAQKYALIDMNLGKPITYTNTVSFTDKNNGFFPIEKKMMLKFINALEEIANRLSSNKPFGEAKQYRFGCTKFVGITIPLATETRMDYVLISNCDNVAISMHLCDTKISNRTNYIFIQTLIKYIKSYLKSM